MTQQRIHNNKIEVFIDNKDTARKFQEEFSAEEPGAENNIRVRSGQWDGRHRFYTLKSGPEGFLFTVPLGFQKRVERFTGEKFSESVDYSEPLEFLKLVIPELPFRPYKHQIKMFLGLVARRTHLGTAATGAGKSLVLYLLMRYFLEKNKKILVLVPTIDLTTQLREDCKDYNAPDWFMSKIQLMGGNFNIKEVKKPILISTWQSAHKTDLRGFDVVLNDEVHLSRADILLSILRNPFEIKLGLTGTPPLLKLDFMKLEQNFGEPYLYINARGLIDLGLATDVAVVPIFLQQKAKIMKYHDEVKFIKESPKRREFVKKFLKKLKGLTIALYAHTEHGKQTWEDLTGEKLDTKTMNDFEKQKRLGVFFMSGSMKTNTRKRILDYLRSLGDDDVILIGQAKILSTGINVKPLKNLVFLASTKSYTQVIQSIGRVLRLHDSKKKATVFDLVDDFSQHRKTENYALRHFWERLSFYEYQQLEVIEKEIQL